MKIIIALGQFDVQTSQPAQNMIRGNEIAREAANGGSDILLLPELWGNGFELDKAFSKAVKIGEGYFSDISAIAQNNNLIVSGSNLRKTESNSVRNSSCLFFPDGNCSEPYDKLHLFEPMHEQTYLERGEKPVLLDTKFGKTGLAVCYDLRFPELFRHYAINGAKLVLLSAQWPYPRLEHWRILLRARAIENQMFIAACNRVGQNEDYEFFGHSAVISPSGEIILEMGCDEGVGIAEVDLSEVDEVQNQIKVFDDRRRDLFDY